MSLARIADAWASLSPAIVRGERAMRVGAYEYFTRLVRSGAPVEVDSYGEYGLYDEFCYDFMCADRVRMDAFREVIARCVRNKTVLDLGTGDRAPLALMAAECGARRVFAVECDAEAASRARQVIAASGRASCITVIQKDSRELEMDAQVDVCLAELVGYLAGADGAAVIVKDAAKRLVREDGRFVPVSSRTLCAPGTIPYVEDDRAIAEGRRLFGEELSRRFGGRVHLRRVIYNVPSKCVLGAPVLVEDLQFGQEIVLRSAHSRSTSIGQAGVFEALILWVDIAIDHDVRLSTFRGTHWAPVVVPICPQPIAVEKGDRLLVDIEVCLSEDGVHPEYEFVGQVLRDGVVISDFWCASRYGRC